MCPCQDERVVVSLMCSLCVRVCACGRVCDDNLKDYRTKSLTVGGAGGWSESAPQEEKDYFTVTDELAQENAHHTVSEKMLEVLELYRANRLERSRFKEQVITRMSPAPPTSPVHPSVAPDISNVCSSSPTSVSGVLRSPSGSTLCHSSSSNLNMPTMAGSLSSPPNRERFSSSQASVELSSWASMSSIATTEGEWVGQVGVAFCRPL